MYVYIHFSICGFGIGCVFVLQTKTRNLREVELVYWSKYSFLRSPWYHKIVQRGRVYKSDNHFLVSHSVYIKIITNRKEKLGYARYRGYTKNVIIFLSFSLITFLYLLNYGVFYIPPPVNNDWMCHPNVDSSMFSGILLL